MSDYVCSLPNCSLQNVLLPRKPLFPDNKLCPVAQQCVCGPVMITEARLHWFHSLGLRKDNEAYLLWL